MDGSGDVRPVTSRDGLVLRYRAWEADSQRAALLVVHGLGEHAGRYASLASHLLPLGISSYALDLRGHGLSGGRRGHAQRFDQLVDDVATVHAEVAALLPAGLPTLLLAHSMGGLAALRYLQRGPVAPLRGGILSAPLLEPAVEAPAWKRVLAPVLSRLLPKIQLSNEIDPRLLSRDPAILEALRTDPLAHTRITPRLYTEILGAARQAVEERGRIGVPLLFLIPTGDRIVRSEAALRFASGLPDAEVRTYPEFYHECLNEVDRARVVADLTRWIQVKVP